MSYADGRVSGRDPSAVLAITPGESFIGAMVRTGKVVHLVVAAALGSLPGLTLAVASVRR